MTAIYGGQESLYALPLDGTGQPELLLIPETGDDQYSQPTWSPDGRYVYLAHLNSQSMATYEILRMVYPNGSPEKVVDRAFWPRVSGDGSRLVYSALDPQTGANSLSFANADGTDRHQVAISGLPVPSVIDAPMFSPDNQSIIFSSPLGLKASVPNWIDKSLGVSIAYADGSLPSDWWSVPAAGGKAIQLTNTQSLALYGVFSPDRKQIASYSSNGIFVMNPDGSEVTMVVKDVGGISGTTNWMP
jgi:Tol biopolymer transport system component